MDFLAIIQKSYGSKVVPASLAANFQTPLNFEVTFHIL